MRRDAAFKRWEYREEMKMVQKILDAIKLMQGPTEATSETKIDAYVFRTKRPRTKKCRKTIEDFAKIAAWDEDIEGVIVHGKCFYFR